MTIRVVIIATLVFRRESVVVEAKIGIADLLNLNFEVDFHRMVHFDCSLHYAAAMVLHHRSVFYLGP